MRARHKPRRGALRSRGLIPILKSIWIDLELDVVCDY